MGKPSRDIEEIADTALADTAWLGETISSDWTSLGFRRKAEKKLKIKKGSNQLRKKRRMLKQFIWQCGSLVVELITHRRRPHSSWNGAVRPEGEGKEFAKLSTCNSIVVQTTRRDLHTFPVHNLWRTDLIGLWIRKDGQFCLYYHCVTIMYPFYLLSRANSHLGRIKSKQLVVL